MAVCWLWLAQIRRRVCARRLRGICLWMRSMRIQAMLAAKVIQSCWQNAEAQHSACAVRFWRWVRQQWKEYPRAAWIWKSWSSAIFVPCTKWPLPAFALYATALAWGRARGRQIRLRSLRTSHAQSWKTCFPRVNGGQWRKALMVRLVITCHHSTAPVGWFSWSDAATLFEEAKRNPDLMKGFVNTVLGEPYEESSGSTGMAAHGERRENTAKALCRWRFIPHRWWMQKDRLEMVAWGVTNKTGRWIISS